MADEIYDGIPTDGNTKVVLVPTLANPAAPTVTELNAGTVVDISCLLTADGWNHTVDESAIADQRLCDRADYERRGRTKDNLEITYVEADDDDENLAFTTLLPGWRGFAVTRRGMDYEAAFASTQKITVLPVEAGVRRQVPGAPNEVFKRVQKLYVRGKTQRDIAVVAGA